ncbi:protein of unknown function [Hyphomicrobium sp. MC1]|nr:protein of unknown function [Hyphomicrobium sp. MC1]
MRFYANFAVVFRRSLPQILLFLNIWATLPHDALGDLLTADRNADGTGLVQEAPKTSPEFVDTGNFPGAE